MHTYVMRYSTSQYNTTQHITTAQHEVIKHINPLFGRNRTVNVCVSPLTKYTSGKQSVLSTKTCQRSYCTVCGTAWLHRSEGADT